MFTSPRFGAYGMAKRALHDEGRELAMGQLALCGAWAGLCACVVVARWASLALSEAAIAVSYGPVLSLSDSTIV